MNPYPLALLNHLTLPVMRTVLLPCLLCGLLRDFPLDRVRTEAPASALCAAARCRRSLGEGGADELQGTKKDRECLRGLDFNAQGTPLKRSLCYGSVTTLSRTTA